MTRNPDATVYVYRHRETKAITALYSDAALDMLHNADYEHVATLEPRAWIQAHYDDARTEREACAQICDAASEPRKGYGQTDEQWAASTLAERIRARVNP